MAIRENIIIILCLLILGTSLYIVLYGCSYPTEHFKSGSMAKVSKGSSDDAELELENSKNNRKYNKRFDEVPSEGDDISQDVNDDPTANPNDDDNDYNEDDMPETSKSSNKNLKSKIQKFQNNKKGFRNKDRFENKNSSGSASASGKFKGSASASRENFKNSDNELSTKEKKLLDGFVKGQLSDDEVEGLIESGAITEDLVEKFLQHLEIENFTNPTPPKFNYGGMNIEPFTGNNYSTYY